MPAATPIKRFFRNGNWISIPEKFGQYFIGFRINDDLSINTGRLLHPDGREYRLKLNGDKWAFTYLFVRDKLKAREAEVSDTLNFIVSKYLEHETPYIEEKDDNF